MALEQTEEEWIMEKIKEIDKEIMNVNFELGKKELLKCYIDGLEKAKLILQGK